MTACATSPPPTPHPDRVPPAAGPAGGGGCCTGGGPPHGRVPAALPPPASGSPGGRPRRRGPAPQPSPSRPRTRSPRRRGGGSGPIPPGSPRSGRWTRCPTATCGTSPRWRRSASASRGPTAPPGQRRCGWCKRAGRSSCGRSAAAAAAGTGGCVPTPTAKSATEPTPTPVRARPVEDAATVEAVTGAYAAKYGDSPYVQPLMTEEAGRRDAAAGAPTVAIVAAGRRAPDPGRTRPAKAVQTQGAGRRSTTLTQRLQPQSGRAASGRSVGGASVRRPDLASASERGTRPPTPRPGAPVHRLAGITPQRPRSDTVRAAVRLAFSITVCGLVPSGSLAGVPTRRPGSEAWSSAADGCYAAVIEVIPEPGRTPDPAFPQSISLCSYFATTSERFYAEATLRGRRLQQRQRDNRGSPRSCSRPRRRRPRRGRPRARLHR
jgi:hypothetical protein